MKAFFLNKKTSKISQVDLDGSVGNGKHVFVWINQRQNTSVPKQRSTEDGEYFQTKKEAENAINKNESNKMKTFVEYLEGLAVTPQVPNQTIKPIAGQQQAKQVVNVQKAQELKKQVYQKYGQPGTPITAAQKGEIEKLYIQNGEDMMGAPIVSQQGTNQAYIE